MSTLALAPIADEGFRCSAAQEGDGLVIQLAGCAEMQAKDHLTSMLGQLHKEALRLASKQVTVDFRALEFMNSSCFKCFVTWLGELQETAPEQQYRVRFRSDTRHRWQRASLHALSCFAVTLVTIEA